MKKKKYLLVVYSICLIILIAGISYAAWLLDFRQTKKNTVATSCFDISLSSDSEAFELQKAYPILDEDGQKLVPYSFTITNNCESYASYQVNLEVLNTSTLTNANFVKIMVNEEYPKLLSSNEIIKPTLSDAITSYKLVTGYLDKKESRTYDLRIWLDEDVTMEDAVNNLLFKTKITVTASYAKILPNSYEDCIAKYGESSIQCGIIATVDTTGACPKKTTTGNFILDATETEKGLLCAVSDNLGPSYIYRGIPIDNYVKFGGFYWRIIRVNGDGSIRMIYIGPVDMIDALDETTKETVLANGYNDASTDYSQIGVSNFNTYWKKDNVQEAMNSAMSYDNASMGYMYGNRDGVVEASTESASVNFTKTSTYYFGSSYNYISETDQFELTGAITTVLGSDLGDNEIGLYTCRATSNTTCQMLSKVSSITVGTGTTNTVNYKPVIYGTTSKASAQKNTNDSTIKVILDDWYKQNLLSYEEYIHDGIFCNNRSIREEKPTTAFSNLGYGPETTAYHWYDDTLGFDLSCSNQNDRFTVDDEVNGNGDLTYPIGLISAEEIYLAGGSQTNYYYYLISYNAYWTMTPGYYGSTSGKIRGVSKTGNAIGSGNVSINAGIRPVISLKANSLKSGSGTWDEPYQVTE